MAIFEIGKVIRNTRIELGISQEELCDGICDIKTLSALENGKQLPHDNNFEYLMKRLGLCTETYYSLFLGARDYECFKSRTKIKEYLARGEFNNAEQMIYDLEGRDDSFRKGLNLQFLCNSKATIYFLRDQKYSEALKLVNKAIHVTKPFFDEAFISTYLLAQEDIAALNLLACIYNKLDENDRAINILYAVKDSMDKSYYDEYEKSKMYPVILSSLSEILEASQRYKEAIDISRVGRELSVRRNKYFTYPVLLYNEIRCLHKLGNDEECRKLIPLAYYVFKLTGQYEKMKLLHDYAKNEFSIEL